MIELDQHSYILGFWYCHDPRSRNDWMLCMQKRLDTGKWKGDYRFRYKKDDKIFGSDDKKSWYSINPKLDGESEPDDEMEKILDGFQQHIRMMYPDADKLIIKGGLPELLVKCKTKGWMHIGGDGRHFELLQGGKK